MTDTQPTLPLPPEGAPRLQHRRRGRPWVVALVVALVLAIVLFLAEGIAHTLIRETVQQQVRALFSLPADQHVEVQVDGSALAQLVSGTLGRVEVAAPDVTTRGVTGDVRVVLRDVDIRNGYTMSGADATVTLDEAQLTGLLAGIDGLPVGSVALAEPHVTMTVPLTVLGVSLPVGVVLTPGASEGALVLTPVSLQLAGAQVTADALRQRLGSFADPAVRDWRVCLAGDLPRGIRLDGIRVAGSDLVATFAIDGNIAVDASLRATGSCS